MELPARTCPKCGSGDYLFRGRKKIEPTEDQETAVETKYRCQACGHEWKVRVPGGGGPAVQVTEEQDTMRGCHFPRCIGRTVQVPAVLRLLSRCWGSVSWMIPLPG